MSIHQLRRASVRSTQVRASVCVIGAGVAGLIAATRLAGDKRLRVVLVESGLESGDPVMMDLDRIENPTGNYIGASRARGLGGTSTQWAGKLLPLTPNDIAARPYLNLASWPFDAAELNRYGADIESLMKVDDESYEEGISDRLDPDRLLPRGDPDFALRWAKRPAPQNHNLAHVLHQRIRLQNNLDIWLDATVATFTSDPTTGRVTSVTAVNQTGHSLRVEADEYLVSAGTLESTRLLLMFDRQCNDAISRHGDALGRCFNDHFGLNVAVLRPIDASRTNQALADRMILANERHLHFELRPDVQISNTVASAYFDIGVELPEESALTQLKTMLRTLKGAKFGSKRHVGAILRDLPSLWYTAHWRLMRKQKYWPTNSIIQIKIWIEQLPHWQNRISLSDKLDALHHPRLKFEYRKTDAEERLFRVAVDRTRAFWARHLAEACRLEWIPEVANPDVRLVDKSEELAHPAGSTRMGLSPSDSVVNSQMQVHRIPNLSVASASVFPTSGSANPTYTIMQLAMRAADAIGRRLQ